MAEFVDRRMEEKIPYLELLSVTGLLDQDEIKLLIQETASHEYKIQRKHRTLDDFMRYIQYQLKLLEKIQKKREEINYFHKIEQIEDVIRNHINCLFGVAGKQFHNRLEFWSARINYAKSQGWSPAVRKYFEQVTKLLGKKFPQLWIEASNFEWSIRPPMNIDAARKILQLGLRDHPDSEALYVAAFRLEVEYINILEQKQKLLEKMLAEENGDLIVNKLALAKVIYKVAKQKSQKSENFFLKFFLALNDARPEKAHDLVEEIKRDAEEDLALREANKGNEEPESARVEDIIRTQFQNFSLFFANAEEAIKSLKSAKDVEDISFWTAIFRIIQSQNIKKNMENWFQLCSIPKSPHIIIELRLWVLNFYSLSYSDGIEKAGKWYNKIQSVYPTSPRIHLRMIEIEKRAAEIDVQRIRAIFDRTLLLHGKDSPEAWLEYIRFEKKYRSRENHHCVIYSRGLRELAPALQDDFRMAMIKDAQVL